MIASHDVMCLPFFIIFFLHIDVVAIYSLRKFILHFYVIFHENQM